MTRSIVFRRSRLGSGNQVCFGVLQGDLLSFYDADWGCQVDKVRRKWEKGEQLSLLSTTSLALSNTLDILTR